LVVVKVGEIKAKVIPGKFRFMVFVVEDCSFAKFASENTCDLGNEVSFFTGERKRHAKSLFG
jgi:hypothetical protein